MTFKPLTADEVSFKVTVEPEDIPVKGNYMCTDDPEQDRKDEQEILDRLKRGDELAWCCILVEATWEGYTGIASIGGNSLTKESEVKDCVDEHGLKEEA